MLGDPERLKLFHFARFDLAAIFHYLGVMATLMQMQGRHADAVGYYQAATRISPEAGRWLIGLGLSLEELQRPLEAKDAYVRARDTGKLAREHQALVDQKLRQLR